MEKKRRYADRAEYIKKAVSKRRNRLKDMAIEYKGGKCKLCGYKRFNGALEFHHLGSSEKDFGVSKDGLTRSWERVKKEINKCILVCANCHRELHGKIRSLPKKFVSGK
jgi:5-methylcytosine-specific restriction endonuclease McrA